LLLIWAELCLHVYFLVEKSENRLGNHSKEGLEPYDVESLSRVQDIQWDSLEIVDVTKNLEVFEVSKLFLMKINQLFN